ncbi:MAG: class I SAM-dependent methyltransferase [Deltaproteobacteria bacterium]|nr:class I SAM-dependent methyltransferase [Deltaproteobacteria bacterium]
MNVEIEPKAYDDRIIAQGIQFQVDNYYEPVEIQSMRRIETVLNALNPQAGEKILDVGCGVGTFAFHAAKSGAFTTGIDYSVESIKVAEILAERYEMSDRMKFTTGNAISLPFENSSFDKIVSADFIEHITLEEKYPLCVEMCRVLKPGGLIVIFTPNGIREKIGDVYWHIRHFLFGDKVPTTDLHFGLTHKCEFEKILRQNNLNFKLLYTDTTRPYLAKLPLLKTVLGLNLLWIIKKEMP